MSDIIEPVPEKPYLGVHTIQLSNNWSVDGQSAVLNPSNYKTYAGMRNWLYDTGTPHRFHWINTGNYLPDSVSIAGDGVIFFMLKYGVGN